MSLPDTVCKTDPRAPHGFMRNASHSEDRYVCECEYWEPPEKYYNHIIRKWASENSNWYPSAEQCAGLLRELGVVISIPDAQTDFADIEPF